MGVTQGSGLPGPAEANWDVEELLVRLDDDREFLRELLRIFDVDIATSLRNAKAAQRDGDLQNLMRAGHTMKGMLRNLSMHRAAEIACALERSAREGKGETAEAILIELEQALSELLPEVHAHLREVKS